MRTAHRLTLIPIPVSVLDISEQFRELDPDLPVTREELRSLVRLAFEFVPVSAELCNYARTGLAQPGGWLAVRIESAEEPPQQGMVAKHVERGDILS